MKARQAIAVSLLATGVAAAESPPQQWEARPGLSAAELVKKHEGKIVSTDAAAWPDGRSVLVMYIEAQKRIYRCTDFMTKDYQANGYFCSELIEKGK